MLLDNRYRKSTESTGSSALSQQHTSMAGRGGVVWGGRLYPAVAWPEGCLGALPAAGWRRRWWPARSNGGTLSNGAERVRGTAPGKRLACAGRTL